MLRRAPRFLLDRASTATMWWCRPFSDLPSKSPGDSTFVVAWKKAVPNIDPPKAPSAYMAPRPSVPFTIPSKLTVDLVLPYDSILSAKEMGVLPGHVAELKPGILSAHEGNDINKYFLSSEFAFIHTNSFADIIAVEATPVDCIDPDLVRKGLAKFQQKLNSESTDVEKAEAQLGVDVHSALSSALTGSNPFVPIRGGWFSASCCNEHLKIVRLRGFLNKF